MPYEQTASQEGETEEETEGDEECEEEESDEESRQFKSLLLALAADQAVIWGLLVLFATFFALFLFGLLGRMLSTPVPVTVYQWWGLLLVFGSCFWFGFLIRQTVSGPMGAHSSDTMRQGMIDEGRRCTWKMIACALASFMAIFAAGAFSLAVGAKFLAVVFIGLVPFSVGFAAYAPASYLRDRIQPAVKVSHQSHRIIRAIFVLVTCIVVLVACVWSSVHRRAVLAQAVVPPIEDNSMIGVWDMVSHNKSTLYWSFEMHKGPEPASQFQALAHPLGTKVVRTFVATPYGFHKEDLACAHKNGNPGYLLLLHENGILGFIGKLYKSNTTYNATTSNMTAPSMDEMICFAKAEDDRLTIVNVLHAAFQGCFCFGMFIDSTTMYRYNRWAWDTGDGWRAVRRASQSHIV